MSEPDSEFTAAYLLHRASDAPAAAAPEVDWLPGDLEPLPPPQTFSTVPARQPNILLELTNGKPPLRTMVSLDLPLQELPPKLATHQLRYGEFLHSRLINYVQSVAGNLGLQVRDLLRTGFEEVGSILSYASRMPDEAAAVAAAPAAPAMAPPGAGGAAPGGGAALTIDGYGKETLEHFVQVARLLQTNFGGSVADAQRLMQSAELRQAREYQATFRWLTLPLNLSRVYFSPDLKAMTELALVPLSAKNFSSIAECFDYLLDSTALPVFAQLVARMIQQNRSFNTRSGGTHFQMNMLQEQINRLILSLRTALEAATARRRNRAGFVNPL